VGFAFFPVFAHHQEWYVGGDAWKELSGGLSIVWGNVPLSYKHVQSPGAAWLLVPAAFAVWHLRLELPFAGLEPSALLVLLPYMLVIGSSIIFATDGLARRLGVDIGRRTVLDGLAAVFALPVIVRWGHPEDVVSIAFAMFAASACIEAKWWKAGWLFGAAVLFQPLAILMVPSMLALAPTTTLHLPSAPDRTVAKLGQLTKSVACYKLLAGTDLAQIPDVLCGLVEQLNNQAA